MIGNVTDFIAYAAARGETIDASLAPIFLTKANDYIDRQCWVGDPSVAGQDGSWPRIWFGASGEESGTPGSIVTAVYRLAMAVNNGVDLDPVMSGKQITKAAISGAVSVEYQESSIGNGPSFSWWDSLVGGWLLCEGSGINFDVFRG